VIYSKVVGTVWATERVETIQQAHLKLVAPCLPVSGEQTGPAILAVDLVGCRKGDQVLVVYEGSSTRFALNDKHTPCEAIVVGIVDRVDMEDAK
jgi:ethanolamine utilization protein EutN